MKSSSFASVSWCVEDVIENAAQSGVNITQKRGEKLLRLYEKGIEDAMVQAGWQVIEEVLINGK